MATTSGNRGRFSERLKKIAFRKRRRIEYTEDKNVKTTYNNVLKVLAAIPGMVYSNVLGESSEKENGKEKREKENKSITIVVNKNVINDKDVKNNDVDKHENIIDVSPFMKGVKTDKKISETSVDDNNKEDIIVDDLNSNITYSESKVKENKIGESILKDKLVNTVEDVNKDDSIVLSDSALDMEFKNEIPIKKGGIEENKQILDVGLEKHDENVDSFDTEKNKEYINSFVDNDDDFSIDNEVNHQKTGVGVSSVVKKNNINNYSDYVVDNEKEFKSIDNQKEQKLAKEILNGIKKKLVLTVNNLEILQSELYILSEVNGEEKTLKECEKQIKEIKDLLKKIEKLKEKYDYLRDNYDFEYLLTLDDDNLIQKIIDLRNNYGKQAAKGLVDEYKLLDEYKFLSSKVDKIDNKVKELEVSKEQNLEKLRERDIDFEKLKSQLYNVSSVNSTYNQFITEQNQIVKELNENVSKITSYEQITYHFEGFNKLLLNSFKYLGLLMLKPFRGSIPAIATETLITYSVIKNLYNNLTLKEDKKVIYEAIDYESTVNSIINNMDLTSNLIDNSLSEIVKLKMEYSDKFSKYEGDFSEYKDVIYKINDIENKILGNKIKVEMIKQHALEQKKANNKKLILVDKLNSSDKNNNFY